MQGQPWQVISNTIWQIQLEAHQERALLQIMTKLLWAQPALERAELASTQEQASRWASLFPAIQAWLPVFTVAIVCNNDATVSSGIAPQVHGAIYNYDFLPVTLCSRDLVQDWRLSVRKLKEIVFAQLGVIRISFCTFSS